MVETALMLVQFNPISLIQNVYMLIC